MKAAADPREPPAARIPPEHDADFTIRALALALSQVLDDAGRSAFVVGLSGGIDSALAAAIASRAAGPGAVRGYFLPSATTPGDAGQAAAAVAGHLGIGLETVPVEPLLDAARSAAGDGDPVRRGNLLARFRMALLYDRASAGRALVLGTSNKSEIALGYTTLWGDMCADCWPLGDLYKTQVYDLARSLGLPVSTLERPPSAELWDGQTDEDELGFSYSVADRVLYYYLEERRRPAEIVARGEDPGIVDKVLGRVRSEAFKRRLPQAPKLTARTVGHDFHHPRAWRGPA